MQRGCRMLGRKGLPSQLLEKRKEEVTLTFLCIWSQQWTSGTKQGLKLIPCSCSPTFLPAHCTKHKEVVACSTNNGQLGATHPPCEEIQCEQLPLLPDCQLLDPALKNTEPESRDLDACVAVRIPGSHILNLTEKPHLLVHCCTLSLCYLGAETDDQHRNTNIKNKDHLVGD